MPTIDFYILSESSAASRFQFACRLIEKAYKNQHRVYVHTENEHDAHTIDELLWTYREESFLPHHLIGEGPEPIPPIQIGFGATPEKHHDILINLSLSIPVFYQQFSRVLELVIHHDAFQTRARENYRHYRDAGLHIRTHKLQTVEQSLL